MGKGSSGKNSRVEVLRAGTISAQGDGTVVDRANSVSASPANTTLDVTDFGDEGMDMLRGVQEGEFTIGGVDDPSDSGQDELNTAVDDAEKVDVAYWPDENGSRAVRGKIIITEYTNESEIDSPDSFEATGELADGNGFEIL